MFGPTSSPAILSNIRLFATLLGHVEVLDFMMGPANPDGGLSYI